MPFDASEQKREQRPEDILEIKNEGTKFSGKGEEEPTCCTVVTPDLSYDYEQEGVSRERRAKTINGKKKHTKKSKKKKRQGSLIRHSYSLRSSICTECQPSLGFRGKNLRQTSNDCRGGRRLTRDPGMIHKLASEVTNKSKESHGTCAKSKEPYLYGTRAQHDNPLPVFLGAHAACVDG